MSIIATATGADASPVRPSRRRSAGMDPSGSARFLRRGRKAAPQWRPLCASAGQRLRRSRSDVRAPVDHRWRLFEARRTVDRAEHLHDPLDPSEVAQLDAERDNGSTARPCAPPRSLLKRHVRSDIPAYDSLSRHRSVAADIDQPAVGYATERVARELFPAISQLLRDHDQQLGPVSQEQQPGAHRAWLAAWFLDSGDLHHLGSHICHGQPSQLGAAGLLPS